MEKVRPWCGQPLDRGRLKNRTEQPVPTAANLQQRDCCCDAAGLLLWAHAWTDRRMHRQMDRHCTVTQNPAPHAMWAVPITAHNATCVQCSFNKREHGMNI